jgi:hypothetical protein
MPSLKFRFNTECQMTIESPSYEEAYLKFKDFMHGQTPISIGDLEVCPPEDPMIFFEVDEQTDYSTIENFNGDFVKDIVENCREDLRTRMRSS